MDLKFQIGKSGLTQGVLEALRKGSENYKSIRISVLKSSGRDRNSIKELADSLISGLNYEKYSYTYKVIGFTMRPDS